MIKNVVLEVELGGVGHVFFSIMSGVGHQNFVPLRGGGSYFFEEPAFHFLWPPPLYFLTSPLRRFSLRRYSLRCYADYQQRTLPYDLMMAHWFVT